MKKLLTLLSLAAFSLPAQNLIFNGELELGTDGYACRTILRPDTNPKLVYTPLETAGEKGGKFLLVRSPFAERFELYLKEFPLKPDTDYTLRFKAKCSVAGQPLRINISRVSLRNGKLDWNGYAKNFTLGTEWQNFEFKFNSARRTDGFAHLFLTGQDQKENPVADFSFDSFELFETKSAPDNSVQIAVSAPDYLVVSESAAPVAVTAKAANFTAKTIEATMTVSAMDDTTGKNVFQTEIPVKLTPGEIREFRTAIPLKYGCYTLNAALPGVPENAVLPGSVAVVGKYTTTSLNFDKDFCVSLNGGLDYSGFPKYKTDGYLTFNAPVERRLELLAKMGCRMLREHDGGYESTAWYLLEKERGKLDFSHLDRGVDLMRRYDIEPFACLGRINFLRPKPDQVHWWGKKWPDWLDPLCKEAEYAPYNWASVKGRVFLPPLELWRAYVRNVAAHAKGRIHYYELFNEPNGVMSAKSYFPFMKATYEEIKAADPDARVIGLSVTEDFGVKTGQFVKEMLQAGGAKYMDIASFHPYTSRELSSIAPADAMIAEFRQLFAEAGDKNKPIWNTELYYTFDTPVRDGAYQGFAKPHHIAARFLTDLGEGVAQSNFLNLDRVWKRRLIPNHDFGTNMELVPNGCYVAFNALARFFEAARPVSKHRVADSVIAYGFRKNGKPVAAVWNYGKRDGISIDLSGFEVFDLFGNPLKSGELPCEVAPYYLRPGALSDTAFFAKLAKLPVKIDRPVVPVDLVRLAGGAVYGTLFNQSADPVSGVVGFRGGGLTAKRATEFFIPANSSIPVAIPVREANANEKPRLLLYVNGERNSTPVVSIPVTLIRNESAEAGKTQTIGKTGDFGGIWSIRKEQDELIFELSVDDSTDSGSDAAGRYPWEQDSAELFFDFSPFLLRPGHPRAYSDDTIRVFLLPRLAKERTLVWSASKQNIRTDYRNTESGYSITLRMPCRSDVIGFVLKLNDARPGAKTHRELRWASGPDTHNDRTQFNIINLKGDNK